MEQQDPFGAGRPRAGRSSKASLSGSPRGALEGGLSRSSGAVAADSRPLPDIQSEPDTRRIFIPRAGVKGLKLPIEAWGRSGPQRTVASLDLYVSVPPEQKGAHMSRFVSIAQSFKGPWTAQGCERLAQEVAEGLGSEDAEARAEFPYFVVKKAPVTGIEGAVDYTVAIAAGVGRLAKKELTVGATVTSLCPCSKEISRYGAHNQRSLVTVCARLDGDVPFEDLIDAVESCGSGSIYSCLKRPDEKAVTERAYENPKFVEDIVRDVALKLRDDPRIVSFWVESDNLESIHNHSAYARLEWPARHP